MIINATSALTLSDDNDVVGKQIAQYYVLIRQERKRVKQIKLAFYECALFFGTLSCTNAHDEKLTTKLHNKLHEMHFILLFLLLLVLPMK